MVHEAYLCRLFGHIWQYNALMTAPRCLRCGVAKTNSYKQPHTKPDRDAA